MRLRASTLPQKERGRAMIDALEMLGLDVPFLPRLALGLPDGEMQRVAPAILESSWTGETVHPG